MKLGDEPLNERMLPLTFESVNAPPKPYSNAVAFCVLCRTLNVCRAGVSVIVWFRATTLTLTGGVPEAPLTSNVVLPPVELVVKVKSPFADDDGIEMTLGSEMLVIVNGPLNFDCLAVKLPC